jgi:hypothetical protein
MTTTTAAEFETQFRNLGEQIRKDLWQSGDEKFLKQVATNAAGLTQKLVAATDAKKKQKYEQDLRLLGNHVAVMAFSRANIVEKEVGQVVLRLLSTAVNFLIDLVVSKL